MNDIIILNNTDANYSIQYIMVDGAPYFKGKEIATILGYTNTKKAIIDHVDEDDKKKLGDLRGNISLPFEKAKGNETLPLETARGHALAAVFINESGLYSLILQSKKPEAKAFKRWVTLEVLPSMRRQDAIAPRKPNNHNHNPNHHPSRTSSCSIYRRSKPTTPSTYATKRNSTSK